jgi:hypothetical protein
LRKIPERQMATPKRMKPEWIAEQGVSYYLCIFLAIHIGVAKHRKGIGSNAQSRQDQCEAEDTQDHSGHGQTSRSGVCQVGRQGEDAEDQEGQAPYIANELAHDKAG